jgi:hypothetical protein
LPVRRSWVAVLAVLLAAATSATAQNAPRVGYVFPAGGQRGTSFEIAVGGQYLDGVDNARLSGAGVKAVVLEHVKPLNPQQANQLREKLKELQKEPKTAENVKEIAAYRKALAAFLQRPANPAISETVRVEVTLAADAPLGGRELRLATPAGLSNPLVFRVGQRTWRTSPCSAASAPANPDPGRPNCPSTSRCRWS